MVLIKCPNCKKKIDVGPLFRGFRICPSCGEKLIVSDGIRRKRAELLNKKGFFERFFR
ncbi:MAG: hypothetical protein ACTSX6_14205 [Candidatus Heimdallarchaeaceae archaeon]